MAQGYYTLDEAAKLLAMPVDELKMIARRGEIRSFQDRGTWRFRVQDIQELARRRGMGSDPELPLGEAAPPRASDSPPPLRASDSPPPKSQAPKSSSSKPSGAGEVFDFTLEVDDESQTDIGKLPSGTGSGKLSSKKNLPKTPQPGSDSDVRLVGSEDDAFRLEIDSDVKMTATPKPGPKSPKPAVGGSPSPSPRPKSGKSEVKPGKSGPKPSSKSALKKTGMAPQDPIDSGVRLVPMDSDSDVRILPPDESTEVVLGHQQPPSAADSDIRLEHSPQRPPSDPEGVLTEEINLDEELRKHKAAKGQAAPPPQAKVRPGAKPAPKPPAASPFELSEMDLGLPPTSDPGAPAPPTDESSSDFELTPAGESSSPIDLGSDELHLELPDEDVTVGETSQGELKGASSGINLGKPIDSGISLEEGGSGSDEIEFELELDDSSASHPPAPAAASAGEESSSEFELTLDADAKLAPDSDSEFELTLGVDDSSSDENQPAADSSSSSDFELTLDADSSSADSHSPVEEDLTSSDSEFELTLEASDEGSSPVGEGDSSSEFELTLEDSSVGMELELDEAAPKTKHEKDIFDADAETSGLEEESGSEAVALDEGGDTDLESSDFDIALGEDEEGMEEEESGSEVMALEEEDEDDTGAAVARKGRKGRRAPALEEEEPGWGGLEEGAEEEGAEEAGGVAVLQREAVAAPWGALPVVFLLPCVVVMFLVGVMGFELVQSMSGYKQPGFLTEKVSKLIVPK
jgi:excisionase family DNA binding protein